MINILKIRNVRAGAFETNSSSMHSIAVMKDNDAFTGMYTKDEIFGRYDHDGVIDLDRGNTDFGRYPFEMLTTFKDKLRYVIAAFCGGYEPVWADSKYNNKYQKERLENFSRIKDSLKDLGIKDIHVNEDYDAAYLDENGNVVDDYYAEDGPDEEDVDFTINAGGKRYEVTRVRRHEVTRVFLSSYNFGCVDHQSAGILESFLKKENISIKDFLINKKYVIVIDGDEYGTFNKYLLSGILHTEDFKEIYGDGFRNSTIIGVYHNGNYIVAVFDNGTKVRLAGHNDDLRPKFPESIDVTISHKCSNGCRYCYAGCTKDGNEMKVVDDINTAYLSKDARWIGTLHPYTEVALNLNSDIPAEFETLLYALSERDVFTNITVNQMNFDACFDRLKEWQDKGLVYGIGISVTDFASLDEVIEKSRELKNVIFHLVLGLFTKEQFISLKDKDIGILLLGYKTTGRGGEYKVKNKAVDKNISDMMKFFKDKDEDYSDDYYDWFKVLCMDTLAADMIKDSIGTSPRYEDDALNMGREGEFTFYIDAVDGKYGVNSFAGADKLHDIGDKSIKEMFADVRKEAGFE